MTTPGRKRECLFLTREEPQPEGPLLSQDNEAEACKVASSVLQGLALSRTSKACKFLQEDVCVTASALPATGLPRHRSSLMKRKVPSTGVTNGPGHEITA